MLMEGRKLCYQIMIQYQLGVHKNEAGYIVRFILNYNQSTYSM